MTIDFWVQMVVYALSLGTVAGTILTKLKYLEQKIDGLAGIRERVVNIEASVKQAHFKIDAHNKPSPRKKKAR